MNGIPVILLLIYSGFTINLVLQCGLGIRGVADSKSSFNLSALIKISLMFLSIIFLWFFFAKVIYSLIQGVFIYIILFPVSVLVYEGLEYLIWRFLLKKDEEDVSFISFASGITAAAVFICINLSNSFTETVILSFGFSSGILIVNLTIREIRRRAALEAVPVSLRGKPLVLIAMGLLSLILTTSSLLLFNMIGIE